MRRAFGPRTVIEAAFLVAVPVVALVAGLGPYAIVAASAVGYLLVLLVEAVLWRGRPAMRLRRPARGRPAEPEAAAPQTAPLVTPPPVAVAPALAAPEPVAVEPEPEQEPDAEPEPEPVRMLTPVPDPEPEPEPAPEPEPEPEPFAPPPAAVVPIGVGREPRTWNLWDLERLTREHAGDDAVRDEERTFLLMYLREFAGPDGVLPVDFDGLVRDSFGELVGAR